MQSVPNNLVLIFLCVPGLCFLHLTTLFMDPEIHNREVLRALEPVDI